MEFFTFCMRDAHGAQYHMIYHARQTVYNYFRHWQRLGVWQKIHTCLRHQVRQSKGRTSNPTASIIDSQSVKTAEKKGRFRVTMAENA
jgi:putative transposase